MKKKALGVLGFVFPVAVLAAVIALMVYASSGLSMPLLDTRGEIGNAQRDTLYLVVAIMLIVVIPVFIILLFVSMRYRATNNKSRYTPNWASDKRLEAIWWGIPILIVSVLSVVAWQTSHSLDPYKPLVSEKQPLNVQVIALQWRWLFLYPDHNVASIGELAMPVDRPVSFSITSDAPMNSFWIPQLGGQVYAMSGMTTKLHLDANQEGEYRGLSANLSGEGHKSMTFTARAMNDDDLTRWFKTATKSPNKLSISSYEELRKASKDSSVKHFVVTESGLFDSVVSRYGHNTKMERE